MFALLFYCLLVNPTTAPSAREMIDQHFAHLYAPESFQRTVVARGQMTDEDDVQPFGSQTIFVQKNNHAHVAMAQFSKSDFKVWSPGEEDWDEMNGIWETETKPGICRTYQHGEDPQDGRVSEKRGVDAPLDPSTDLALAPLLGLENGNARPVMEILRDTSDVTVARDEKTGDFTLSAATRGGDYRVTVDPSQGFGVVRFEVHRRFDQLFRGTPLWKLGRKLDADAQPQSDDHRVASSIIVEISRLEKVGDKYMPTRAHSFSTGVKSDGDTFSGEFSVEQIAFDAAEPSDEQLAVNPPDATQAFLSGSADDAKFEWRGGKVVEIKPVSPATEPGRAK